MDLGYADGTHDGVSYLQAFYDSGQEIVARISGNRIAREIFTVSGGNKTISKISVRLAHVSGNSNLNLKILDSSGSQIASENISNNLITERNWSNWTGNSNVSNGNWVSMNLQNPVTLLNGSTYSLTMSSPSDTTFAAVPIRYKDFSAETDRMLSYAFKDGKAQESLDNGSTWQDVYSYQPQANFQFYLTIASRTSTNTPTPTPINIDAGLTIPTSSFQFPTTPASGGQIRNVISYGATCNDSSNDDSVGIKAAIAASIAGDEVIFPSNCTLHLKTWPIDLKTGVNIKGQDKTTSVLNGMFSSAPNPLFYARTQPSTSTNQPVSNLSITNFSYTTLSGTPPDIFIKLGTGTWNTDNSEWKVVSKIRIENLTIEKFKKYAIDIQNSQFIYVANNVIKNATSLGGGGEGYGIKVDMDKSQNNWIKGNIVGPVIRHAYLVQYDANHNLFDGNSATGTTQDAFDMHGENEFSNEFRNNTVTNCVTTDPYTGANTYGSGFGIGEVPTSTSAPPGDAGAHDFSGDNNWIHDNSVSGCYSGVRVNNTNNTYIENNDITNNRSGGILIGDLDSYVFPEQISNPPAYGTSNVIAKNNTIKNNPVGFKLKNAKNTQILNNITTNNTGSGLTLTAQTTGYTITGNDFRFNGSTVNLGGNTSGTFTNNLQ